MNRYDGFSSLAAANGTVAYGSTASITPTANAVNVSTMNSYDDVQSALEDYFEWSIDYSDMRVEAFNAGREVDAAAEEKENKLLRRAQNAIKLERNRLAAAVRENPAAEEEADEFNDLLADYIERASSCEVDMEPITDDSYVATSQYRGYKM